MEEVKQQIIEPVIDFIKENFGLEDQRFEGLIEQLNGLDLTKKSDGEFKEEIISTISSYCKDDAIDQEKLEVLESILLQDKSQKKGVAK